MGSTGSSPAGSGAVPENVCSGYKFRYFCCTNFDSRLKLEGWSPPTAPPLPGYATGRRLRRRFRGRLYIYLYDAYDEKRTKHAEEEGLQTGQSVCHWISSSKVYGVRIRRRPRAFYCDRPQRRSWDRYVRHPCSHQWYTVSTRTTRTCARQSINQYTYASPAVPRHRLITISRGRPKPDFSVSAVAETTTAYVRRNRNRSYSCPITIRYDTIDDLHWKTDRQAPSSI